MLKNSDAVTLAGPDQAYWQELADLLEWRISAFNKRESCHYLSGFPGYHLIQLWAAERDRIVEAVRRRQHAGS